MEQLLIGQSVDLALVGDPAVRVEAFVFGTPPREILLTIAPGTAAPQGLAPGTQVILRYASGLGLHEARTSIVRVTAGKSLIVAVARLARVTTVQRRRFFRVAATLSVHVEGLEVASPDARDRDERALTQDVSAGGLRLETVLPLATGDRVRVALQVPRGFRRSLPAELTCEAVVIRVGDSDRNRRRLRSASVEFRFARESERDRWVQLTFDLQRGIQI